MKYMGSGLLFSIDLYLIALTSKSQLFHVYHKTKYFLSKMKVKMQLLFNLSH